VIVFTPELVDLIVPVVVPLESVTAGVDVVFPVPPLTEKVTVLPTHGLKLASDSVTVMVEVATPSEATPVDGLAEALLEYAFTAPARQIMLAYCVIDTAPTEA
jgi:hypothetical protein